MTNRNEREAMILNTRFVMVVGNCARWIVVVIGIACCFAAPARGQQASGLTPQFEVSGGYSYVRANAEGGSFNLHGGSGSFSYNFTDHLGVVADVGAYRFTGLPSTLDSTMYTYLFGPRYTFRKLSRVTPFAQVLLGGGRLNANSSTESVGENGFAMAVGGGVDLPLRRRFSIRLIQAEYLLTRFDRVTGEASAQNNIRISAGVVFRFGSK